PSVEARRLPSGLHAKDAACTRQARATCQLAVSHTLTSPCSAPADASRLPSGLQESACTRPAWQRIARPPGPIFASISLTVPLSSPTAKNCPSGLQARHEALTPPRMVKAASPLIVSYIPIVPSAQLTASRPPPGLQDTQMVLAALAVGV